MNQAVAIAYGWQDLDLGHDFHQAKQGIRFTISETVQWEVLEREARCKHRLLQLNHDRYIEEIAQGLHDKNNRKVRGKPRKRKNGTTNPKTSKLASSSELHLVK